MRNLYDQYAKEALCALLAPAGPIEAEKEVRPEAQRVDLYFVPEADRAFALHPLGLLGRLASHPCSLEHFHDSPSTAELVSCLRKHLNFCHLLMQQDSSRQPPMLWVLSSGRPTSGLRGLGLARAHGWPNGVYLAAPPLHMGVVVLSELREERETLALRLLGTGRTLNRATAELRALASDALEVCVVLPIMVRFRLAIPADPGEQTSRDKEFLMSTQDALEIWEQRVMEKGREEGLAAARYALLLLYQVRFGAVPAPVHARVQSMSDAKTITEWSELVSREPRDRVDRVITGK